MSRLQQSGHALGSDCTLTIITDESDSKIIFQELWATIHGFEARFSRFQTTSELTAVNHADAHTIDISPEFYALVSESIAVSKQTRGLYNPLILPALQQSGYKGSWPTPTVVDDKIDYSARSVASVEDITLSESSITLPADSALDFGGIGKGYLLDELADMLDAKHVEHYWLSLGGDIVMRGFNIEDQLWRVGIANAFEQEETISFIENATGKRMAIATSGTAKRKGAGWHHIIDPRTSKSAATDIVSATVVHDSATQADVLAKCIVIVGSDAAPSFATTHSITKYVMQLDDETTINTLD